MSEITVITGAGTGIGKALALNLVAQGHTLLAVGRRLEPLEELQSHDKEHINIVTADVSLPEGREAIAKAIPRSSKVKLLIHNAGILSSVCTLDKLTLKDFRHGMSVNTEGPLFLTQCLLSKFCENARVLHVSSGAAHFAIPGWLTYCTSKAALHMIYQSLSAELSSSHIYVGSVSPGIVETPIQSQIRDLPVDDFPNLEFFHNLKEENKLVPVTTCAAFLEWLLLQTAADEFIAKEWDIYDNHHHKHWLKDLSLPNPF